MAPIEKRKRAVNFTNLKEPQLTKQDWQDFYRGIELFNHKKFWEAHEAWEEIWRRHKEESRIFFQGLIQMSAGFHQLNRNIYHGTQKHLHNALWKLKPFQPTCLNLDIKNLVTALEHILTEIEKLGRERLHLFPIENTPRITYSLPE